MQLIASLQFIKRNQPNHESAIASREPNRESSVVSLIQLSLSYS